MSTRKTIATAAISALIAGGGGAALAAKDHAGGQKRHGNAHAKRLERKLVRQGVHNLKRAVHAETVVPAQGGASFVTVTYDRGTVTGVAGDQLSIKEGTKTATYKTITLTIPAGARVRVNGAKATLADVKADQKVVVLQAPARTLVVAHDPKPAPATP